MRGVFWLIILFFGVAFGEDIPSSQWRDAQTFFEAGRYQAANEIYEEMLKKDLNARDERVVLINQGITYLAMNEPEMAVTVLQRIALGDDPSPYLVEHLKSHLAECFLIQAEKQLEGLDISDEKADETIGAIQEKVSGAQKYLDEAVDAAKQRLLLEGNLEEEVPSYLKGQGIRAKQLMVQVLQLREQYLSQYENLGERLLQLVIRMDQILSDMELTAFAEAEKSVLAEHLSLWAKRLKKDDYKWRRLRNDLEESKESLGLLVKAQSEVYTTIDLLKEQRLWEARASLAKAKISLKVLYGEREGGDVLGDLLAQRYLIARKAPLAKNGLLVTSFEEEYRAVFSWIQPLLESLHQKAKQENQTEEVQGLQFLADRMEESVPEEKEAYFDLLFYNQLSRSIGELLARAYLTFKDRQLPMGFLSLRVINSRLQSDLVGERAAATRKLVQEAQVLESLQMKSSDKALQAADLVEKALMTWEPKELLIAKLEELVKALSLVLEKKDFSEKSLEDLQKFGVEISGSIIEILRLGSLGEQGRRIQNLFQNVVSDFDRALAEQKNRRQLRGWFFLEDGLLWTRRTQNILLDKPLETPSEVLKKTISEQSPAIHLTELVQAFASEELESSIKNLLALSQIEVLEIVTQFEEVAKNSVENWEQAEKISPWSEVLEYVEAGNEAAKRAEQALYETQVNIGNVVADQRLAKELWEKALDALEPPEEDDQESDSKEGEGEADSSLQQPEEESGSGGEAAATLQLLQQMESDDEEVEEKKMIMPKRGLRPW